MSSVKDDVQFPRPLKTRLKTRLNAKTRGQIPVRSQTTSAVQKQKKWVKRLPVGNGRRNQQRRLQERGGIRGSAAPPAANGRNEPESVRSAPTNAAASVTRETRANQSRRMARCARKALAGP